MNAVVLGVAVSGASDPTFGALPVVLIALMMAVSVVLIFPLRSVSRWLVDRLFYGDVASYESIADVVRGDAATTGRANEDLGQITARLVDGLGLESMLLFLGRGRSSPTLVAASGTRADEVSEGLEAELDTHFAADSNADLTDLRWGPETLLVAGLTASGQRVGHVVLGPKAGGEVFVEEEKNLVRTIAPLLALTLDQSILTEELSELNQRLIKAQEVERKRVAVDIHDGPLQKSIMLAGGSDLATDDRKVIAQELVDELREISSRLRPSILDDLGLAAALEWLTDGASEWSGVRVSFSLRHLDEDERFPPDSEQVLFRVTQEAINNTVKHANASRLKVSLSRESGYLALEVQDDGVGFSPAVDTNGGFGLPGMRERVRHLKGTLEINSAPGLGTTVVARLPIDARSADWRALDHATEGVDR